MAASGKRRARLPSLHDAAARFLVVLLLVGVAGGAAVLGAPLLTLVAGFVAVALAIDHVFPATGFARIDSRHAFQRLVWQRRRQALGKRGPWRRDYGQLELLPFELEGMAGRRHVGIQPIPLDSIIGTVEAEKAVAFDGAFRPPSWSRGRWELMWIACRRGDSLPPISVCRLDGRHFVIDGHHRVSVARSLDALSIDADVIELLPFGAHSGAAGEPPRSRSRPSRAQHAALLHTDGRRRSPVSPNATERKTWKGRGLRSLLGFLAVGLGSR